MIEQITFKTAAPESAAASYEGVGLRADVEGNLVTLTNPQGYREGQDAMSNAAFVESVVKVKVAGGTDHGFVGDQQAEYDSLSARGRTAYDHLRWYDDKTHDEAFAWALGKYGLKKS